MIEDETQSEIGEKDRPAEGGQYNLKRGVQMCVSGWEGVFVCVCVCTCKSEAKEVSILECLV